jgi:hypothetical protein
VVGLFAAVALWQLRASWRRVAVGLAAGLASFAAAVVPALPEVLAPGPMLQHLRLHGTATLLEAALLGQAPVGTFAVARSAIVWRPLDVVLAALLEPFANPRTPIRLWADVIFDPLGAALIAVGLVTCVRAVRRSAAAGFLLVFYLAALSPAFVSPVDRVDVVHAVVLPVPAALLAAAGFAAVAQHLAWPRARWLAAAAALAVSAGGTLLFDVVNPRLLPASSTGIVLRAVDGAAAERTVVLDYPRDWSVDVRWLFTGPITAFAGPRPLGFLEYGGGELPLAGLAAEGKDLLFWSPGLEQDLQVTAAVCAQATGAVLYELDDDAGLSRVHAARLADRGWQPTRPTGRWRSRRCPSARWCPAWG